MTTNHSMELEIYHKESLAELQGLLEDEEFVTFLESQPKSIFTDAQKSMVRRLARHITGGNREDTGGDPTKKPRLNGKKSKDGRAKKETVKGPKVHGDGGEEYIDDWKPITDIAAFTVDQDTREQLQSLEKDGLASVETISFCPELLWHAN
jgi:hypothetical protein